MSESIGTAFVEIRPDTKGFQGEADRELSGASSRIGSGAGKLLGAALGAAGGLAIGGFLKSAIGNASDLNETLSKARNVFGDASKGVEDFAKGAAKNLGVSKTAALDAAAQFGNMFTQLGFTNKEAAKTSEKVLKLGADLGSYNNLPTAEVLDKISGSLRGEFDSLQALIPNINAARVEQEALAETGKKTAKELTAQEKATATLAIITKDGAGALDDFAETSDGLAGQQKILSAQFEETKTALGEKLLPAATAVATFFVEKGLPAFERVGGFLADTLGPVFSKITDGLGGSKGIKSGFQTVTDFVTETALPTIGKLRDFFEEKILPTLGTVARTLTEGLKAAFEKVKDAIEDNRPQLEKLVDALGDVVTFIVQKVAPVLAKFAAYFAETLGTSISGGIRVIGGVVDAIQGIVDVVKKAIGFLGDLADKIRNLPGVGAIGKLAGKLPGFADGGTVGPGFSVVGERGPELIFSARGGERVVSNSESRALLAETGSSGEMRAMIRLLQQQNELLAAQPRAIAAGLNGLGASASVRMAGRP